MSGLYPISNGDSLKKSKQGVTSESSVRKVTLVVAQMMASEKQREKKGMEPSPGRELRGYCSNLSKKMQRTQFKVRISSY